MRRRYISSLSIIVYDITYRESFEGVKKWFDDIRRFVEGIPVVLIGNKADLVDQRVVSYHSKKLTFFCSYLRTLHWGYDRSPTHHACSSMIDRSVLTLKLNQLFDHQMTHVLLEKILVDFDGLMITKYEKAVYYN